MSPKRFNTVFIDFLRDLNRVFPNDIEIRQSLFSAKVSININPYYFSQIFAENLLEYEGHICNRDEVFLFGHTFCDPHFCALIDKIKTYWLVLSEENKATMWRYLDVLLFLVKETGGRS